MGGAIMGGVNITATIEHMAHSIGYELRALESATVRQSEWLTGLHRGKLSALRRYLRELLAIAPSLRNTARQAFNASRRMQY